LFLKSIGKYLHELCSKIIRRQ
jgi:hypothetical protein